MKTETTDLLMTMLNENIHAAERYLYPGCTVVEDRPWLVRVAGKPGQCCGLDGHSIATPLQAKGFKMLDAVETTTSYAAQENHSGVVVESISRRQAVREWLTQQKLMRDDLGTCERQ